MSLSCTLVCKIPTSVFKCDPITRNQNKLGPYTIHTLFIYLFIYLFKSDMKYRGP